MKLRSRTQNTRLEARLQADAEGFRPVPPPRLHERILARVHSGAEADFAVEDPPARSRQRPFLLGLGAAAAVALVVGAWWTRGRFEEPEAPVRADVASLADLLAQPASLLASADDPLWTEAENVWSDAALVADDFVRGLPAPLRERFAGP